MNEKNQQIIIRQSKTEIKRSLVSSVLIGVVFLILLLNFDSFSEWIALENKIAIRFVWIFNLVFTSGFTVFVARLFWHDLVSKIVVDGNNITIRNNRLKVTTISFEEIGKIKYTAYSDDRYKKTEKYAIYSKNDEMLITITEKWKNIKKFLVLLEEKEVSFEEVPRKNRFGYNI